MRVKELGGFGEILQNMYTSLMPAECEIINLLVAEDLTKTNNCKIDRLSTSETSTIAIYALLSPSLRLFGQCNKALLGHGCDGRGWSQARIKGKHPMVCETKDKGDSALASYNFPLSGLVASADHICGLL